MTDSQSLLKLALPKGRIHDGVRSLLSGAGINVTMTARSYRPRINLEGWEAKILKPQSVALMLGVGSRDVGFTGADWIAEHRADVVELLDTKLDPVRLVAAAPVDLLVDGQLPRGPLVVASEYEQLTRDWLDQRGEPYKFVRTHGATEVFPPDDADCIVDNTSTGATLEANGLRIVAEIMRSSTRMFASQAAMGDPARRGRIEDLVCLVEAVLEARRRVMIEMNVQPDCLDTLVELLPCMRRPTVARLHGDEGFAVKAAILRRDLPALIPRIRAAGGSDIVVTKPDQIIV
ncbi:MAG: ATP phosphoribosyltransferase [Myxococcales bacterium FL481]|nr:MAG: ATP phosphoribosyltransferase [Myxococcales bacterium FL481]